MSDTKPTGGPAFPTPIDDTGNHPDYHYAKEGVHGPGMSLRQYAAITLKVPDSGEEWLDQMIRQSLRDEMAGKAMQGLRSNEMAFEQIVRAAREDDNDISGRISEFANQQADCMLKAREQ